MQTALRCTVACLNQEGRREHGWAKDCGPIPYEERACKFCSERMDTIEYVFFSDQSFAVSDYSSEYCRRSPQTFRTIVHQAHSEVWRLRNPLKRPNWGLNRAFEWRFGRSLRPDDGLTSRFVS